MSACLMKPTDEEQTKLRPAEPNATLVRSGTELRTLVRAEPEGTSRFRQA